jgi:hypothetical protein
MNLRAVLLALIASTLVVGCSTPENQPTAAETALENMINAGGIPRKVASVK